MTVDGQNRDLVNIWRHVDIEGGDHLILHLSPVTRGPKLLYTLNHYHNGTVSKCMSFDKYALQLIPTFYKARELDEKTDQHTIVERALLEIFKTKPHLTDEDKTLATRPFQAAMDYRVAGYWHCGQTYTKSARIGQNTAPFNDLDHMNGALLQVNWAPVWKSGSVLEWLDVAPVWKSGSVLERPDGPENIRDQINNAPDEVRTDYDAAYLMAHIGLTPTAEIHSDAHMYEEALPRREGARFETPLEKSPKKQKTADSSAPLRASAPLRVEAPLQLPTASRDSVPFPEAVRPKAARRKAVFCDTATPEEAELERIFTSHGAAQETPDGA